MHEEGGGKVVPYLERKSTEEPSGVLEQGVDGLAGERNSEQNGWKGRTASRRSAAGRNPGEGYGGGQLRGVVTRQERRRRWGK